MFCVEDGHLPMKNKCKVRYGAKQAGLEIIEPY
jgi:hypothetical protein